MKSKDPTIRTTAKAAGVSPSLAGRKRRQGKSDEQIVAEARRRKENLAAKGKAPLALTFAEAQRRKELALAELRELDLAVKRRNLLDATEVSTAWQGLISSAKSKLLLIGDELGDRLAAEGDPIRCREMVIAEVRRALTELSQYRGAETDQG